MPFHDTDEGTTRYEGQNGYKSVHCPVCQSDVVLDADATQCRCGREINPEANQCRYCNVDIAPWLELCRDCERETDDRT